VRGDGDDGEALPPSSETGQVGGLDLYPTPPFGDLHGEIEGACPPIRRREILL
jgi:hypothetical protein